MTLAEFICRVQLAIQQSGGDGSIVYNSSVSNAMIACYTLVMEYCRIRRIKTPILPIAIINKSNGTNESYTQFKFEQDSVNTATIYKSIENLGLSNTVNVSEFVSTVNVEIFA